MYHSNDQFIAMKPLTIGDLYAFVASSPIALVFVSSGLPLGNQTLLRRLTDRYADQISFGALLHEAIDVNTFGFKLLVAPQLRKIGLPDQAVAPGYYLLHNKTLLGWHPGSFEEGDVAHAAKVVGLGVGILQLLGGKDLGAAVSTGLKTYEFLPAAAAFQFFSQLLDDAFARETQQQKQEAHSGAETRQEQERRQRQAQVFETALDQAYRIIGVDPSTTDDDLKREHKRLSFENHPDRARNPTERARREEYMKRLNQAYGIVAAARGL